MTLKDYNRLNTNLKKTTLWETAATQRPNNNRALTINLNSSTSKKWERNEGSVTKQAQQLVYAFILGAIVLGRKNPILVEEDTSGQPRVTESEVTINHTFPS